MRPRLGADNRAMAVYLMGDVQGCDGALAALLDSVAFSASRDTLVLLGDLVNRGPDSAGVLRRAMRMGAAVQVLLGNHDLSLLALAEGKRPPHANDSLAGVLTAPDRDAMLEWLRHGRMALHDWGLLMVHGGVLPAWTVARTLELAGEVESALQGPDRPAFLASLYGNEPDHWRDTLQGADRLRVIVNALTRIRFCTADGHMDMRASGPPEQAPAGFMPWYDVPGRKTAGTPIAFGHWSALGYRKRDDIVALDTGCVWGRELSALRLGGSMAEHERIQVPCSAS